MAEMKRLADLKAEQEKTEQRLKALSNKELKDQAAQLAAYEAKMAKMLEEYNHYITFREPSSSLGVMASRGLVIKEPESWIFFYNGNFDLVLQREEEFNLATTTQLIKTQSAIQRCTSEA
uniref:Uncharacterized protein n=1 Tax=Tanacetum cinerariifolium TaxID=118510 RepID=A0A6L2KAE7_TANCI|nr:hypothetical protein [Tanacetum cinerariifolium]